MFFATHAGRGLVFGKLAFYMEMRVVLKSSRGEWSASFHVTMMMTSIHSRFPPEKLSFQRWP